MEEAIFWGVVSFAALYVIYRFDPEKSDTRYSSMWSFYRKALFGQK